MPVKLEHISNPTEEDWNDLGKIHLDTQPEGFTKPRDELEKWLADGGWIIAARFNDRLIGAMLAKEVENSRQIALADAGVRTITQNRGVMHQLLELLKQWASKEGRSLVVQNPSPQIRSSLENRGFLQNDDLWIFG